MGSVQGMMGGGIPALAAINIHVGNVAVGLTAAGSAATDALQLTADTNVVTTTASGTGVKVPGVEVGSTVVIINGGANALLVYPPTGGQMNNQTVTTAGRTIGAGKAGICLRVTDVHWALMGDTA